MASGKALVLLSGGLDSGTCLYWAKRRFSDVSAITFNYHGRIDREMRAAADLAESAGVSRTITIDLPFVKEMSDLNGEQKSPNNGLWSSYIPARNMMFYSISAYHAELFGISRIIGGHNAHDTDFFKDASKTYVEKLNELFRQACLLCDGRPYRILLPLAGMQRIKIIKLALKLGTPLELTWSCHRQGNVHCGQCYSCQQRLQAFEALGMPDPAFRQ